MTRACPECGQLLTREASPGCSFHVSWRERAAIKEFDGRQQRTEAERQAWNEELARYRAAWGIHGEEKT